MALLLVWILNAVALLAVAYLLPGIVVASFGSALIAALVLGLLNMLVKPVLVVLTLVAGTSIRETALEETRQRAALQAIQVTTVSALETVKTNGQEASYVDTWRAANDKVLREFFRLQRTRGVFASVTAAIQFVGPIMILVATQTVSTGSADAATIASVQALSAVLLTQVGVIASSATQLSQGWALLERVADVLLHRPDTTFSGARAVVDVPSIEVRGASFSYSTFSAPVLRDVSLAIPAGAKAAVVGASGSGKSTLGRLLVGLHAPTEGEVRLAGHPLREYSREGFYRAVAYVPQSITLDTGSVRDNIAAGSGPLDDDEIAAAARKVGLHDEITALPLGYDTPVAQLGQNFSGGQRQRIALARAAVTSACLVVLDEATSSLDSRAERLVTHCFDTLGATQVVIAHRLSTVVDADVIFVMDRGRLVEQGTHDELMRSGEVYPGLYARSAREADAVGPARHAPV